jgi:hypothetical protein
MASGHANRIKAKVRLLYRRPLAGPLAAISVSDVTSKADTNVADQDGQEEASTDIPFGAQTPPLPNALDYFATISL